MGADGYEEVSKMMGHSGSPGLRRILEYMMTEQQARLIAALPGTHDELAKKVGTDVETVKSLSEDLFKKGAIVPKDFKTLEGMRFIPIFTFFHDRILAIKDWDKRLPALAQMCDDFLEKEVFAEEAKVLAQAEQPPQRVLPAYKAILDSPELLPEEDVRTILKGAKTITVVPCSCRVRTGACKRIQTDVCMQFDRSAEYGIAVGMEGLGRPLSYEEALAVIDAAEEAGLLHLWGNTTKMSGPSLCSCCDCCCIVGLPYLEYHLPPEKRFAKSRYIAKVDPDVCIGCADNPSPPCIAVIPKYFKGCLRMVGRRGTDDFKAVVDTDRCFGCGACVLNCPVGAIKMELVRPASHVLGS
ncbi:MAG: 4Fe-4S dicluster domain-containing protein [Deltaproteobacteria bacterium]|nr:4Fe-4S dicluster domain-containing protein [Deltaproteobacteria bacterium]